jgi:hypothetical protein
MEAAEKDIREMEVKRWRHKTVDREWAPATKEAKSLSGP